MSDNTIVIVGLKGKDFKNHTIDRDGSICPPKDTLLSYAGYGYETGDVWHYDLKSANRYCPKEILPLLKTESDTGSIFGIYVVGTWSGAIDLESIQEYIDEAKHMFKERTGQEGKVYVIGEQV